MKLETLLLAMFEADRQVRNAEADFLSSPDEAERIAVLERAVQEATKSSERRESSLKLERLAELCAQVSGPKMVDCLIQILNEDDPAVRVAAGESLLDVGYERYAELARGIERTLDAGGRATALCELAWIISEIGEPSASTLLKRFLKHDQADVVAAAIEAFASIGDPEAIAALTPLLQDRRNVTLSEDEEDEGLATTVGELAKEAIRELKEAE